MSIKINGVRFSVVWIVIVFKKLKLTSQGKKNKLNVLVSQETSFSEWIAKLMHITRLTDNQFSILVCSKWERKPTLNLNYIANHFLPTEWHSAAVGGFHIGPQIQHWLINAHLKCFLVGVWALNLGACEARKFCSGWLTQRPTAYAPSDKNAHSQTYQDKSIILWFTIPWILLCKENYTPHQMDTQNHSKQAPDSTILYYISQGTFHCGSH